jgi:hypothetical protein
MQMFRTEDLVHFNTISKLVEHLPLLPCVPQISVNQEQGNNYNSCTGNSLCTRCCPTSPKANTPGQDDFCSQSWTAERQPVARVNVERTLSSHTTPLPSSGVMGFLTNSVTLYCTSMWTQEVILLQGCVDLWVKLKMKRRAMNAVPSYDGTFPTLHYQI